MPSPTDPAAPLPAAPRGPAPGGLERLFPAASILLRTRGWSAADAAFAALLEAVAAMGRPVEASLVTALAAAREHGDAIAAADLLDGVLAPRLGHRGALPARDGFDAIGDPSSSPRRSSALDAETEADLQLEALALASPGACVALLGARGTALLRRLAAIPTPQPLLLWDPAAAADVEDLLARRPIRVLSAGQAVRERPQAIWIHPGLRGDERRAAERWRARLQGATALRAPRCAGPPRVVVLVRERPFHLDAPLTGCLRQLGCPTAVAVVHGDDRDDALAAALARQAPDLVLSVNAAALTASAPLRAMLEVAGQPTVAWFVDDPELALGDADDLAAAHVLAMAWEREAVARLRRLGFRGATYLPHGARWTAAPGAVLPTAPPLLWIATSYAGDDRQRLHAGAGRTDGRWSEIRARLRRDPRLSPASLRQALAPGEGAAGRFRQLQATDIVAAERRGAIARALLPHGLQIFGDPEGWRRLLGAKAPVHGDVDATVVPALVGGARLSVDCAHPQMPSGLTQRVFDVPACGGLVLADDRPDLREHFEVGVEVLAYASPEEAAERAAWALAHPSERRRMAQAATRRVQAEHRLTHRVRSLLQRADHHFGLGTALPRG